MFNAFSIQRVRQTDGQMGRRYPRCCCCCYSREGCHLVISWEEFFVPEVDFWCFAPRHQRTCALASRRKNVVEIDEGRGRVDEGEGLRGQGTCVHSCREKMKANKYALVYSKRVPRSTRSLTCQYGRAKNSFESCGHRVLGFFYIGMQRKSISRKIPMYLRKYDLIFQKTEFEKMWLNLVPIPRSDFLVTLQSNICQIYLENEPISRIDPTISGEK